jgi:hypothetical protein
MTDNEAAAVRPSVGRRDWLVSWSVAADTLGRTTKTLTEWYEAGHVPAVRSPGGQLSAHASWLADVMASAKPGEAGDIPEVTRDWWARHEAAKTLRAVA